MIKTALVVRHRQIPANLHFETPSPHIDFDRLGLAVPTALQSWPDREPALAAVSSFGFGGTNCHVVLGEAQSPGATFPTVLDSVQDGQSQGLAPVFVYGGQGSQWPGMAAKLAAEPAFAHTLRACDRAFAAHLDGSIAEALVLGRQPLTDTRWIQAAIFTMQVSLTAGWAARGVVPGAVIGLSLGEVAAAHVSGAISLDDAATVLAARTRLIGPARGKGGMAVLGLSAEAAQAEIDACRLEDLGVAVVSAPNRTVVAGGTRELERLCQHLVERGAAVHRVDVDYASHSPHMDAFLPELEAELAGLRPGPAHIPFWSTVVGDQLSGSALDAAYWCRNLRAPVLFGPTLARVADTGARLFVDANPHPITMDDVAKVREDIVVVPSLRREEPAMSVFTESAAVLRAHGVSGERRHGSNLLLISARTERALDEAITRTTKRVRDPTPEDLVDVCHTAARRRDHHEHRLAVIATDPEDAVRKLQAAGRGARQPDLARGNATRTPRTIFTFAGEWDDALPQCGPHLFHNEPAFRRAAHHCAELLRGEGGADLGAWLRGEDPLKAAPPDVSLLARFVLGVGLTELWHSWGVDPDAVVGHGIGEVVAAHTCGALSLPDAARVARHYVAAATTAMPDDDALRLLWAGIAPRSGRIPFVSAMTGTQHPGGALGATYWIRNLHSPAHLADAVAHLVEAGPVIFLELGPHPRLPPEVRPGTASDSCVVSSLQSDRPVRESMLAALATLHVHGAELDWDRVPLPAGHIVSLPAYPWQHERYWIGDSPEQGRSPITASASPGEGPEGVAQLDSPSSTDGVRITELLAAWLAPLLGMEPGAVPVDKPLLSLGVSSLVAMQLHNTVRDQLGIDFPVSRWLQVPDLRSLGTEITQATQASAEPHDPHYREILL